MTTPEKPLDDMEVLLDSFLAELTAMTDAEVLDGVDPAAVQAKGLAILSAAKQGAGRRRLAAAKEKVALTRSEPSGADLTSISASDAKAYLREAANADKYTLAARGLDEMSDEDAIRIYSLIRRLEADGRSEADKS